MGAGSKTNKKKIKMKVKITKEEIKKHSNYSDYSLSDHFYDLICKEIERQGGLAEFFKFLKITPLHVLISRFFENHMTALNIFEKHCRSLELIIDELDELEELGNQIEDQIYEVRKSQGVPRYVAALIVIFLFYCEDLRKSTRRLLKK